MNGKPDVSNLLIDETPLQFLPSLAIALGGTNEALLMQQLHFLCAITEKSKNKSHYHDGQWWVYNSYEEWHKEHFPWIAASTIKRIFLQFEKDGLVIARNKTEGRAKVGKWYAINYEALAQLHITPQPKKKRVQDDTTPYQNDTSTRIEMIPPPYQNEPSYYTENTTENTDRNNDDNPPNSAAGVATTVEKPKGKRTPKAPQDMTAHEAVIDAYVQELGYNPPNGSAMGAAAAWLVKNGYTPEQVRDCYRHFKAKPFYADKPLSLQTIRTNIPDFLRFVESQPAPSPTEAECLTALENVNKVIERDRIGNPIAQLPKYAAALAERGETFASVRSAWMKCKKARSPVGAFLTWVRDNQMVVGVQGEEKVMYDDSGNKLILVQGIGWQQVSA